MQKTYNQTERNTQTGTVKGLLPTEEMTVAQKVTLFWQLAVRNGKHSYAGTVPAAEIAKRRRLGKAAKAARKVQRAN